MTLCLPEARKPARLSSMKPLAVGGSWELPALSRSLSPAPASILSSAVCRSHSGEMLPQPSKHPPSSSPSRERERKPRPRPWGRPQRSPAWSREPGLSHAPTCLHQPPGWRSQCAHGRFARSRSRRRARRLPDHPGNRWATDGRNSIQVIALPVKCSEDSQRLVR